MAGFEEYREVLEKFVDISLLEIDTLAKKMSVEFYEQAVNLILEAEGRGNRVHVTGIGKPGHVAGYVASLLSSTGTPAYQLDGTEAVHGSSGQVRPGDVVIAISNSGETKEMKSAVNTLKQNKARIIAVCGNSESWLAKQGDAYLFAGVGREGDPINKAPRTSISVEILVLQGLSVLLQSIKGITLREYLRWHPGGTIGKLCESELEESAATDGFIA